MAFHNEALFTYARLSPLIVGFDVSTTAIYLSFNTLRADYFVSPINQMYIVTYIHILFTMDIRKYKVPNFTIFFWRTDGGLGALAVIVLTDLWLWHMCCSHSSRRKSWPVQHMLQDREHLKSMNQSEFHFK